jgi:hypothetical protein
MNRLNKLLLVVLILLVLTTGAVAAQQYATRISWLVADRITLGVDGMTNEGNLTVSGTANTGALTAASASVTADLTVGADLTLSGQTAVSVTNDVPITPTGTLQELESAGTVGTDDIAAGAAGDVLVLWNSASTSIGITDTGTLKLAGNVTLGQYDTIVLFSDGTNWIELSRTNN